MDGGLVNPWSWWCVFWMCRVGIKAVVLEQAENLRSGGAALGLWRNAFHVLQVLGLSEKMRAMYTNILTYATAPRLPAQCVVHALTTRMLMKGRICCNLLSKGGNCWARSADGKYRTQAGKPWQKWSLLNVKEGKVFCCTGKNSST